MRGASRTLAVVKTWLLSTSALAMPEPVLAQTAATNDDVLPAAEVEAPVFHVRFEGVRDGKSPPITISRSAICSASPRC